jgi:hypothetical protein
MTHKQLKALMQMAGIVRFYLMFGKLPLTKQQVNERLLEAERVIAESKGNLIFDEEEKKS